MELGSIGGFDQKQRAIQLGEQAARAALPEIKTQTGGISVLIIRRLNRPSEKLDLAGLGNQTVAAVAGIAKPERFFDSLRNMGITLKQTVALPDHADITAADLPDADVVIITEKDAVKFSDGHSLNHVWVLPVYAIIEPNLAAFVSANVSI